MNRKTLDACDSSHSIINKDTVTMVKRNLIMDENALSLANFFKYFCSATRIKILNVLFSSELCMCDISVLLGINHSTISHQLKILKQARLIKSRSDGNIVYYSLDDEHIKEIFNRGLIHIEEKK